MKVLWLNHPECDFGAQCLHNGFAEAFGDANIYDYPAKLSYNDQEHRYAVTNIPDGCTNPLPWAHPARRMNPHDAWDGYEFVQELIEQDTFDLVVVESAREWALKAFKQLENHIRRKALPVVLCCGDDYWEIDLNKLNDVRPDLYLKRELRESKYPRGDFTNVHGIRIVGFPFSTPWYSIHQAGKWPKVTGGEYEYDVFFSCGNTTGTVGNNRQLVADKLRQECEAAGIKHYVALEPDQGRFGGESRGLLPWHQYIETMTKSKVTVVCRGFGLDTMHYWEAPVCTAMVTEPLGLHVVDPLQDGQHVLHFERNNVDQMWEKVKYLLDNEDERLALTERAAQRIFSRHTNEARAQYVVELLRQQGKLQGVT